MSIFDPAILDGAIFDVVLAASPEIALTGNYGRMQLSGEYGQVNLTGEYGLMQLTGEWKEA